MIFRRFAATILTLLVSISPHIASADTVEVQAQGSVTFGWRLKPEDRQKAVQNAKMRALETYVARDSKSLSRYFAGKKSDVAAQVDNFILSTTVLEETEDKKAKTYTVFIRAEINLNGFRSYLEGASETGQAAASGIQSSIAVIFLARQQISVQSFDDKVYKRVDASASGSRHESLRESSSEGEGIGETSIQTSGGYDRSASAEVSSSASTTTGGSRTRKAEKVEWTVGEAGDLSAAMQGILGDAGFQVIDVNFISDLDLPGIRREFSGAQNLSPGTLQAAARSVRPNSPIMAIGTADVGVRDTDPVTGNIRVNVRVRGQVYDLRGALPRTLASVGPIQVSGQNTDESSAQSDALRIASEKAAQAIVDALNAKEVR
jgi:hypothetical protein